MLLSVKNQKGNKNTGDKQTGWPDSGAVVCSPRGVEQRRREVADAAGGRGHALAPATAEAATTHDTGATSSRGGEVDDDGPPESGSDGGSGELSPLVAHKEQKSK